MNDNGTIVAVATGRGGAIAVVRVSGGRAIAVCDSVFAARSGRPLSEAAGYTVHFGEIRDGGEVVDEVLVSVFRAPHSYTGEDAVEISCHASPYIERRIVQLLIEAGARAATPGEFTVRAFLAGKLDLAQAEAVADLIAASGRAGHLLAMGQLRGGVSSALAGLREELTELAALLELELDFSEEDVEFASRERLRELAGRIAGELDSLAGSFALGNAIREGVPVAIVGRPNAGKSTLLNALAGDDRAMVSEIAGTTRDRIEERIDIDGVDFRFIDTAGLRDTDDVLERMGIDRALEAAARAYIVLLVVDAAAVEDAATQISELALRSDQRMCVVVNKIDKSPAGVGIQAVETVALSAKTGAGLDDLKAWLSGAVDTSALEAGAAVISGARHYEALVRAREAIERVSIGLGDAEKEGNETSGGKSVDRHETPNSDGETDGAQNIDHSGIATPANDFCAARPAVNLPVSADMLGEDIREVLFHLGTITGAVTSDDILATIFSKFCIGK